MAISASASASQPSTSTGSGRSFAETLRRDPAQLAAVNAALRDASPQQVLEWAIDHLGTSDGALAQTTAMGLTGLAATDMISRISRRRHKLAKAANADAELRHLVPIIFLDTLYHFDETLALINKVEKKYNVTVDIYKPQGAQSAAEFEARYGQELWNTDEDSYDYLVKVEPAQRAYKERNIEAVITGRRKSQGADRSNLDAVEVDVNGLLKVNPLLNWAFGQVKDYVDMFAVPYNALLDQGYKSVGDWHSTKKPVEGDDERSGRWAGNKQKTECGLHKNHLQMKRQFEKRQREAQLAAADKARGEDAVGESSVELSLLDISDDQSAVKSSA